jgi:hypothetical protein
MEDTARSHIQRLLDAIGDASAKNLVADLMRFAVTALQAFSDFDQLVYEYHLAYTSRETNEVDLVEMLSNLRAKGFKPVRNVISFMTSKELLDDDESFADDEFDVAGDETIDFDFDLGASLVSSLPPAGGGAPESGMFGLDELDIDAAFDFIAPEEESSDREKLAEMKKQLAMLGYAVREEFNTYDQRIQNAYDAGNHSLLLRELDSSRESLTEGLFALVSTIFDIFLGECDRSVLLPGYRDVLDSSLVLRRAIADLTRTVSAANHQVQDEALPALDTHCAFLLLIDALDRFKQAEAFGIMRAPDRLEISNLLEQIVASPLGEARLASEGLSRYLESMSIVNQREVLVQHDGETVHEIREALEAASSLLMVSVANAAGQASEALACAQRLHGRYPLLDRRLVAWEEEPPVMTEIEEVRQLIDQLEELDL